MNRLRIDWKDQYGLVMPYVSGKGGAICIRGISESSAWITFAKLVRAALREQNKGMLDIQLDPNDATARSPEDIIAKIEGKLSIKTATPSDQPASSPQMSVASDLSAGGNITIENVNIFIPYNNHNQTTADSVNRINTILNFLKKNYESRFALILHGWHEMPENTADWFWNALWVNGLEHLTAQGVLVACVCQADNEICRHDRYMPQPNCQVVLPEVYIGKAAEDAKKDMAEIIMQDWGDTIERALDRAETFLQIWNYKPSSVHSAFPMHLKKWRNA